MRRNVSEFALKRSIDNKEDKLGRRKAADAQRSQMIRQASEARDRVNNELSFDQLRLQFLANMNHELRTPLHGLMGATELLSLTKLDNEQQHYLDIFRRSSQQLLGLVDNILDYSKMLSGEFKLNRNHFDLKQVLQDCYEHFLPFARRKNVELTLEISETTPRWIFADAKRVSQITYHLVANALKFTAAGAVSIHVTCDQVMVTISVRDTGVGIPEIDRDRIFEAFYQENTTHTRKYGGAGMGLAISRSLANAMNGDLHMHSEPNRGSEFSVRFPFMFSPSDDQALQSLPGERQPRILLVEDNEINQAIVFLLLSKRGIQIDIAQDGLEGLNCHKKNAYDLIFMDMQMPVMDGIDATKAIRLFDKDVQIVALTANLVPEDKERALKAGMNDFLCKPLDHGNLEKILDQARNHLRN